MRPQKGMMLALMLILSLGALGISAIFSNSDIVGMNDRTLELKEEFELAYTPHDAIEIHDNQDMIDQAADESWPGNGSPETPYVITGYSFNQDTQPLRIWNTDLYWTFTGNLIDSDLSGQKCGTWLDDVENAVISGNTFRHRHAGMYILNVENVNITDNSIYENLGYGLEFGGWIKACNVSGNTIYDCPDGGIRLPGGTFNSTIIGNTIYDCGVLGISLLGSVHDSLISENVIDEIAGIGMIVGMATDATITFNTITNASDNGLQLFGATSCLVMNNTISESGEDGISASFTDQSSIHYNTVSDCEDVGIHLLSGENSAVCWNTVEGNTGYAVELEEETAYFDIKYNTFADNGDICQICDQGDTNDIRFNYYSDWTSPDVDSNGIVDNPYAADGDVSNEDPYPLTVVGVVPEIEEPPPTTPTPTTTPDEPNPFPMDLILIGVGAAVVIVIISGVILRKR